MLVQTMKPREPKSILENVNEIRRIDKSNMLQFCVEASRHCREAAKISDKISIDCAEVDNIVVAGMGGSAIGGELLKDYARNQTPIPIEVSRDYNLPAFASKRSLAIIVSYSGETEESLSTFLDAAKKDCLIYCISSGGRLIEYAAKLGKPYLRVPSGMPPRAALPYLFLPQLVILEKRGLIPGLSDALSEATQIAERVSRENAPEKPVNESVAKSLALGIKDTVPAVYGFGVYRGVAQRWKQQFNENSKVPARWEIFPELDHNEIVGWERADFVAQIFSTIFIRDENEAAEVRSRIETTKKLMPRASKKFEVWSQGKNVLAKMLSTILVGDFASVYLAIIRNVDPTPVKTIVELKRKLSETEKKERIIQELEKLKSP